VTVSAKLSEAISAQGRNSPDLQAVRIQLFSTSGVKVAEGDCSPNGYYFVPVDNPGSYNVRVHGPQGWVFEPQQLSISCDSNSCNGGDDVNFAVTGVELSGHLQAGPVASSCKANTPPSFAGALRTRGLRVCCHQSTSSLVYTQHSAAQRCVDITACLTLHQTLLCYCTPRQSRNPFNSQAHPDIQIQLLWQCQACHLVAA